MARGCRHAHPRLVAGVLMSLQRWHSHSLDGVGRRLGGALGGRPELHGDGVVCAHRRRGRRPQGTARVQDALNKPARGGLLGAAGPDSTHDRSGAPTPPNSGTSFFSAHSAVQWATVASGQCSPTRIGGRPEEPSRPTPPDADRVAHWPRMACMTWNARALMSPGASLFRLKWHNIERGLRFVDVLCVQASHGPHFSLRLLAERSEQSHFVGWSWIRRDACQGAPTHEEIVAGRILAPSAVLSCGRRFTFGNIHNFGISSSTIKALGERIRRDDARGSGAWILQGDWNFGEPDAKGIRVGLRRIMQASRDGAERRRWRAVLTQATELLHGCDTRSSGNASDDAGGSQSALGRAAISFPAAVMSQMAVTYTVPPPILPNSPAARRSDHLPIMTVPAPRSERPSSGRQVSPWVAKHPLFPQFATQRLARIAPGLHPAEFWRRTKQQLRAAAATTRNESPEGCGCASPVCRAGHPSPLSWRRSWPPARSAAMAGPTFLAAALHAGHTASAAAGAASGTPARGSLQRSEARARHWLRLCMPHMQRPWLAGVVTDEGLELPAQGTASALREHWEPVLQSASIDRRLAGAMTRRLMAPAPPSPWPPPSDAPVGEHLARARACAPGPDGVPHMLWHRAGPALGRPSAASPCSWLRAALRLPPGASRCRSFKGRRAA